MLSPAIRSNLKRGVRFLLKCGEEPPQSTIPMFTPANTSMFRREPEEYYPSFLPILSVFTVALLVFYLTIFIFNMFENFYQSRQAQAEYSAESPRDLPIIHSSDAPFHESNSASSPKSKSPILSEVPCEPTSASSSIHTAKDIDEKATYNMSDVDSRKEAGGGESEDDDDSLFSVERSTAGHEGERKRKNLYVGVIPMHNECRMNAACEDCRHQPLIDVILRWEHPDAKEVYVSGSFVNWDCKIPLQQNESGWSVLLRLPRGHHEYRFIVNGDWAVDDKKHATIIGRNGDYNHLIHL